MSQKDRKRDSGMVVRYTPISIESGCDTELRQTVQDDGNLPFGSNFFNRHRSHYFSCTVTSAPKQQQHHLQRFYLPLSFWMLGLLNNSAYVIMIACAKSISEGGTALVFLANVVPALFIKSTAPYWFDKISYTTRLLLATCSMILCFGLVALFHDWLVGQLMGVAFASVGGGLGEASLLALAGKLDALMAPPGTLFSSEGINQNENRGENNNPTSSCSINSESASEMLHSKQMGHCLNGFSSGTGFAGVFGFFWIWFWNEWMGCSMQTTLYLAIGLAFGYWSTFRLVMRQEQEMQQQPSELAVGPVPMTRYQTQIERYNSLAEEHRRSSFACTMRTDSVPSLTTDDFQDEVTERRLTSAASEVPHVIEISNMTGRQRFHLVLSLWPYTIPLFTVYAAEYALQSGTWTAIGFPVINVMSRNTFYQYSNWMYQAGVFFSRSSGSLCTAPMFLLWLMPFLQVANLAFHWWVAANQINNGQQIPDYNGLNSPAVLYAVAFYTGLLGGAVYVHGYLRICADVPLHHREFALSSTSLAESLGIVVADFVGLIIQACLYQINGLNGAVLSCPVK